MKQLLSTLFFISCSLVRINAQQITISPEKIYFSAPTGVYSTPQTTVISGTGLIPASGVISIAPIVKYAFSLDGSSWGDSVNIPYSGGLLPATTVYVQYALPNNFSSTGWFVVKGGGAYSQFCSCDYSPSCPCLFLGVNNQSRVASTTIEPNPVQNTLIINSGYTINNIAITNLLGQVLLAHNYNSNQIEADVSELSVGTYLIRINNTEVQKFVKE